MRTYGDFESTEIVGIVLYDCAIEKKLDVFNLFLLSSVSGP